MRSALPAVALIVALLAGAMLAPLRAQRSAERPPNVLLLFADDQRSDSLGAYGNPRIRTPQVDALAARGFRFDSNHCMGSRHGAVCVPSRAMLHTGRALTRVPDDMGEHPTVGQVLRQHGYATFATGKWHNGRASFLRSFEEGRAVMFGGMSDHHAVPVVDLEPQSRSFSDQRTGAKHSSELFADAAIDWLRGHAAASDATTPAPFFCYVAFTAPHDPRDPPPAYRERALQDRPPLPPNFRSQHGWNIGPASLTVRDEQLAAWPRDPEVVRDQLAEYHGLVEHLDVQVGRILATVDELGLTDDTLIVYAADHGLALGSHGLLGKQSLYEHSMGCPLIFAGPGVPRGHSAALTYLNDVFPTLAAFTGAPLPDDVFGQDLGPLLRGERESVRDSVFTLYARNQRAVRDARWKLLRFTRTGKTLLFDLARDPHETTDLAGDPQQAGRVAAMLELLRGWQQRLGDELPLWPDDPLPLTRDLTGHPRRPDRWQPDWIVEKYFR